MSQQKNSSSSFRNSQIKKVMILYPDVEVKSSTDYDHLVNIHNVAEYLYGDRLNPSLVKTAYSKKDSFSKLESKNDYFYLLFTSLPSKKFQKIAYPITDDSEQPQEFDLNKWAQLVYKIYEVSGSGKMDISDAINYYANTLDKESGEDRNFKKWIKYFQSGEHLKYSEDSRLNKKAIFSLSEPSIPSQYLSNGMQPPQMVFQDAKESATNTDEYKRWISGLDRAIRSIDNSVRKGRSYLNTEDREKLLDLLHELSKQVIRISSTKTASDIAYKYANKFKKLGFYHGYKELITYANDVDDFYKTAQDAAVNPTPVEPPATPAAAPAAAAPAAPEAPAGEATPAGEGTTPPEGEPKPQEAQTPLERVFQPSKGSESDSREYESLAGDVGLGDAISKLEDIASRLSDRRTIRLLAEFDIILDKIGIAPMFPELAEAQSKLIDAYSYALTRVTKMLGMLSSGKTVMDISDARRKELIGKTMKEVSRGIEAGEEYEKSTEATPPTEAPAEAAPVETTPKGPEATQAGVQEAGLTQGTPTTAPLPETPPV